MNNITVGKMGSVITGLAVVSFALSMIMGLFTNAIYASCLASMFIAIGFLPFMVALYSIKQDAQQKACGIVGMAFAVVYAVLVFIVYYAECTSIRLNSGLSEEALSMG